MALPIHGQISMGDINVELGRSRTTANTSLAGGSTPTSGSLFSLANNTVNKTAPHAISEFYGYNNIIYTLFAEFVYSGDPCSPSSLTRNIYKGSDDKYYADQGGTFVLASSISSTWYLYSYTYTNGIQDPNNGIQDPNHDTGPQDGVPPGGLPQDVYVYDVYNATDGNFVLRPIQYESSCAPYSV